MPGDPSPNTQGANNSTLILPRLKSHPTHPPLELGTKPKKNKKKGAKAKENTQQTGNDHQRTSENQDDVAQVCDGRWLAIATVAHDHRTTRTCHGIQ